MSTGDVTTVVSATTGPISSTLGLFPHLPGVFATSANILPQIQPYHGGEPKDGDTFQDWLEHFEAVARLARWDDLCKLVHFTGLLRGTAKSFFRSCSATQRSNYKLLIAEFKKRFTPVQLTAVQTQMFHERKQGAKETVDEFAQELRKLYTKAYSTVTSGVPQAEEVGQRVLTSQFVAGLRSELQAKVMGLDGTMDHIVMKARFEETKIKELATAKTNGAQKKTSVPVSTSSPAANTTKWSRSSKTDTSSPKGSSMTRKCYSCGVSGHMARTCPYGKQARRDGETPGRAVSVVSVEGQPVKRKQSIEELRQELREAELAEAVNEVTPVTHTVSLTTRDKTSKLGPSVFVKLGVNGVLTDALIDTGSPATIVSLQFILGILANSKDDSQTVQEWKKETLERFAAPAVTLTGCGGNRLNIIAQIPVVLSQGERNTEAVVLVQKGAPHNVLLGTDLQAELGFSLVLESNRGRVDLLSQEAQEPSLQEQPTTPTRQRPKPITTRANNWDGSGPEEIEIDEAKQSSAGAVRLIQNVRVPPGYKKIVHARMDDEIEHGLLMCTPCVGGEVEMADIVFQCEDGNCVSLFVENRKLEPVHLREGTVLGEVTLVEEVVHAVPDHGEVADVGDTDSSRRVTREPESVTVCGVMGQSDQDRGERLLKAVNLATEHLDSTQCRHIEDLIKRHSDVFALEARELGTTNRVTHVINTGDHHPIRQPVRPTPFALRAKLVDDMLQQGVVKPSSSPWASPIVLVKKKDGGTRFCVDYRRLIQITKSDEFPLPRIDDTLDLLAGARYFTTLDLASGYWQVEMDESSREKTAFTTYAGLYAFCKMPFGLVNAPATFQRLMEEVLQGLTRNACLVYLDDIVVVGCSWRDHLVNLTRVLERIRGAGLKLKPQKCWFAQKEVEYLGHIMSSDGVRTDPVKLAAVCDFPVPIDVKRLRSFLGLTSYYRRFVPNFAREANALHALTKKEVPFVWTRECQTAFEKLKALLTSSPILAYPDFTKSFVLETDASIAGLGAVLSQCQGDGSTRPVAYASRSLLKHERNYGITELEGLGVVWAVKHFRPYPYGHFCEVFTDHAALKSLLNTPQPSGKLARWGMAIQELNLKIMHRAGHQNTPMPMPCHDHPFKAAMELRNTPPREWWHLSMSERVTYQVVRGRTLS